MPTGDDYFARAEAIRGGRAFADLSTREQTEFTHYLKRSLGRASTLSPPRSRRRTSSGASVGGALSSGGLVRFEISGVDSVIEHLRIVGERDLTLEFGRIIRAGLKPLAAIARTRAPVRSGRLRKSIRVTSTQKRAGIHVRTAKNRAEDYAAPIHWGWPRRNIEANRFVWDTWVERQDDFARAIEQPLADWAARVSRRLNRNVRGLTARRIVR